jgi:hypothetical protein
VAEKLNIKEERIHNKLPHILKGDFFWKPSSILNNVANTIDHTLLKPTATETDILNLVEEAKKFGFAAVCVNGFWASTAKQSLDSRKFHLFS